MKELVKPIGLENHEKELFVEAMCTENDCSCPYATGSTSNASINSGNLEEGDDILF